MAIQTLPDDTLPNYVLSAVQSVVAAAKACDKPRAQSEMTDEVINLFTASAELCSVMNRAARDVRRTALANAGIVGPPHLC